jgi:uncharacterized membrane protein YfcA
LALMPIDSAALAIVGLTFLLAGIIKGVVGLGFSTVSLAVLTVTMGLQPAMALQLAPSFVTHVWQAVAGSHAGLILTRLWFFILAAVVTIGLGVNLSSSIRMWVLIALLGCVIVACAMTGLCALRVPMSRPRAVWIDVLAGLLTGICTGLTGTFETPAIGYCQIVGVPRHHMPQALALVCTASTIGLAASLSNQRVLTPELVVVSTAAAVPAVIGIVIGNRWRQQMPAALFRRVFFAALLVLGLYVLSQLL